MAEIQFNIRWKEELEAISDEGKLIFEITMGTLHVYFPNSKRWEVVVPGWAKEKWEIYLLACRNWCFQNRIPFTIVDDAFVHEEKL
ncbi:MAG: hypothetical protein JST75_08070 [Bacteroidetes bacterium]|nr:hypothetical protein [Bacteroidota bacterium]